MAEPFEAWRAGFPKPDDSAADSAADS
eukprot:IDg10196t1